jgi:phosphate starvation-inducible protein PhoH
MNALDFMIDNFTEIEEMGLVRLTMDDVVRNPLIKKIEAKFEEIG